MTTNTMNADTLNAWIDGTLDPGDRAEVDVAVGRDPALLKELLELQATSRLLADLPEYTPPRSFRLGAEYAKPTPISQAPSNGRTVLRLLPIVRSLGVAAALIFMVVAGSFFLDINGGSNSDPGTTLQRQGVIMGETTGHGEASEQAGDEAAEPGLVESGDAASAADEPMDDMSAMAPGVAEEQSQPAAERAAPFGATTQGESDHSTWILASVVLGGIAVVCAAAWYAMSTTVRDQQS